VLAAVAGPCAAAYDDPRLVPLTLALGLAPVARGLASPRLAHLSRQFEFRAQMLVEVGGKAAAFVASVTVALAFRSHWALIAGMIAAPALSSALSYAVAPYRPRLSLHEARSIFAFSGWLTLSQALNQLNWQLDRFVIGGRLGTATLGQYAVGSELASLPTQAPVQPMMAALFAGFARVAHDRDRFRAAYLAAQAMVMALALPIGFAVSALSAPLVALALGPEWADASFVVAVLAPVFALQMLAGPAQSAAMAAGATRAIFRRDVVAFALRVPLVLAGLALGGFAGVVWARVVSGLAVVVLNMGIMRRLTGAGVGAQLAAPWRSLAAAGAMFAVLTALGPLDPGGGEAAARALFVAAAAAAGGAVYVAVHLLLWLVARRPAGPETRLLTLAARLVPPRLARRETA
jgi:O-antigen/teichoic acid export membrane protein